MRATRPAARLRVAGEVADTLCEQPDLHGQRARVVLEALQLADELRLAPLVPPLRVLVLLRTRQPIGSARMQGWLAGCCIFRPVQACADSSLPDAFDTSNALSVAVYAAALACKNSQQARGMRGLQT